MCKVDINEKKNCRSDAPTPQNLPPKLGSRQNLKSIFQHEAVTFLQFFDIKNEFLDPKNPHVAIFRHQTASEMELQHYFKNSRAKPPSSGRKFKLQ